MNFYYSRSSRYKAYISVATVASKVPGFSFVSLEAGSFNLNLSGPGNFYPWSPSTDWSSNLLLDALLDF